MREQIKLLAEDLLIRNGYRGTSFGLIAKRLKITRANIHYHFGNKRALVEEVLEDYVASTSERLREIWTASDVALTDKIELMTDYSRRRYVKYNLPGKAGRPWSLIARMRQDSEYLSPRGRATLQRFGKELNSYITIAIEAAKVRNEFVVSTPTRDVALQLVSIANSAGPITQDARSFGRLEELYQSFARIIFQAFGQPRPRSRKGKQTTAANPSRRHPGRAAPAQSG
jgi:TetR/AcrR family transcriptional repressor of nem operon